MTFTATAPTTSAPAPRTSNRICPDCGKRLYGAAGITQRPACIAWICRTAGCGYVLGNVPLLAPRCPCGAVIPAGTGRTYHAADPKDDFTLCNECMEGTGPSLQAINQHKRVQRASEELAEYTLSRSYGGNAPLIQVLRTATGTLYRVTLDPHNPRCNCPDYRTRCSGTDLLCKHILMARTWATENPEDAREVETASPSDAMNARVVSVTDGPAATVETAREKKNRTAREARRAKRAQAQAAPAQEDAETLTGPALLAVVTELFEPYADVDEGDAISRRELEQIENQRQHALHALSARVDQARFKVLADLRIRRAQEAAKEQASRDARIKATNAVLWPDA